MKGVILSAGKSSRLRPATLAIGKTNLPIYDKPLIFYSLSLMIECGIDEIYIVCNTRDQEIFKSLLDRFDQFIKINLVTENHAYGSAYALNAVRDYCGDDNLLLLFGDNLFIDKDLPKKVEENKDRLNGVCVFALEKEDPRRYGVIEKDDNGKIISIEEKPEHPKGNLIISGLMMFKHDVFDKIQLLTLSKRGEYEISDLLNIYISQNRAMVIELDNLCQWFDTGTFDSLLSASQTVKNFQQRNGIFGSPEVALYKRKIIDKKTFLNLIDIYNQDYRDKLCKVAKIDVKEV